MDPEKQVRSLPPHLWTKISNTRGVEPQLNAENMLPPHWLDDVFSQENWENQLFLESGFQEAIRRAKVAYQRGKEALKNPDFVGASPAQMARVAFMEVLIMPKLCWKCHGKGTIDEIICGWCEEKVPHSSCDDTYRKDVPCDVCQTHTHD